MGKKVVFVGAGASKPFGYLLTREILPEIQERLRDNTLFDGDETGNDKRSNSKNRADLARYIDALLPGCNAKDSKLPAWLKKKGLELPLITDVLSIIDHSLSISSSPISSRFTNPQPPPVPSTAESYNTRLTSRSTEQLIGFRTLLERAISNVLRRPVLREGDDVAQYYANLKKFADWVRQQTKDEGQSLGIISTNYDTALERNLFEYHGSVNIPELFDFGFSWRAVSKDIIYGRPTKPRYQLYKLHGSLNWLRCELCERIYINRQYDSIVAQAFRDSEDDGNTCYCGHAPLRTVIVAPSIVRDIRDANLLEIWKNALELLRTADEWVIIGYSFPPEDITIRSLFIRAYQGRWHKVGGEWVEREKPKITVVQVGKDRSTFSRYKLFFPNCAYLTGGLESFLKTRKSG